MFDVQNDFWIYGTEHKPGPRYGFSHALTNLGYTFDVIDVNNEDGALMSSLAKGIYNCCIVLGVGSVSDIDNQICGSHPLVNRSWAYLKKWVDSGGHLWIHGEQNEFGEDDLRLGARFSRVFNKPWKYRSYERCSDDLTKKPREHAVLSRAGVRLPRALPPRLNSKACRFVGMAENEIIYGDEENFSRGPASMALTNIGTSGGTLGFFGDVNAEVETINAVLTLAEATALATRR
jgi:hypothetical protein